MKSVNFAKMSVVVAAGDSIDHVYIVKEGELKMSLPTHKRYIKIFRVFPSNGRMI